MSLYVVRRLLLVIPTLLVILVFSFTLIHAAPGDPILALAGEHGDPEYYAFMRARFGLDQPLPQQLGVFAQQLARGDLGMSYVHGRSALAVVLERAPATALLGGSALLLAIVMGIPIGIWSARRAGTRRDSAITVAGLGLYSAPTFWIGQFAILFFASTLGWFPVEGLQSAGSSAHGIAKALDLLRHLALPALVLALHEIATIMRLTRNGIVDELAREHIRTARAKGLPESVVLIKHALPRALLPVVTILGGRLGQLLAGAVVVEIVFGWPGLGRLMLTALQTRDAPVLLALFLVTSLTVIAANLITDLAYAAVDPRVRYR